MMKFLASLALLAIVVSAADYYYEQPDYPCVFKLTVKNSTNQRSSTEYKLYGRYTYQKLQSSGGGFGSTYVYTRPDVTNELMQMAMVTPSWQSCNVTFVDMDETVNSLRQNISAYFKDYSGKSYSHKQVKQIDYKNCDCYYNDDINTDAICVYNNYIYRIQYSGSYLTFTLSFDTKMDDFKVTRQQSSSCNSTFTTAPSVDYAHCPSSSSSSSSSPVPVPSSSSSPVPVPSSSSSHTPVPPSSSSHTPVHSSSSSYVPVHSSSSSNTPVASSSSSGVFSYVQPEFPCAFELTVTTESSGSSNVVEIKSFGRYSYERVGIITTVSRPDIHQTVDGTQMMGIFSTWTGDCTMTYGEIDRKVEAFLKSVAEYSAPYNNKKYNFKETKVLDNKTCDCYYDRDINTEAVYVYENYIYRIHTKTTDITFDYSWTEPKMSSFKFDKDESPECEDYDERVFSTPSKDYSNCGNPVKPSVSSLDSSVRAEAMVLVVIAAIAASLVALF